MQSIEAIARSSAIFVPDDTSLTDRSFQHQHPRVTADIGHSAGLNAELSTKPMSESSRIARSRRVFLRWFAAKPMEPRLLMT